MSSNKNSSSSNNADNSNSSSSCPVVPITEQSMREAIQNLKTAKSLATKNINNDHANEDEKQMAMQLYQSSIEILIRALNSDTKLGFELNKEALTKKVTVALSQAETLKLVMSENDNNNNNNNNGSSTSQSSHKKAAVSSVSAARRTTRSDTKLTSTPSTSTIVGARSIPSRHLQNPLYPMIKTSMYIPAADLPNTPLDSLSGLDVPKRTLHESLFLPLAQPSFYTGLRTPPAGVLFYGPPGTGKTMLVKAAAYETSDRTMFFNCSSGTLSSKWHGEGEKIILLLFQIAQEAGPSIIFLDEMDSLLGKRGGGGGTESEVGRRFKTEFMVQMDGMTSNKSSESASSRVWVMGCTNTPWDLDDAILRRFTARVYVPLPDATTRKTLLGTLLRQNTNSVSTTQLSDLVQATEGYSCSDLMAIGREAAFGPLRDLNLNHRSKNNSNSSGTTSSPLVINLEEEQLRPISHTDFKNAVQQCTKSVSKSLLQKYKDWEEEQGGGGGAG